MPFFFKGKDGLSKFYKVEPKVLGSGNFASVKKATVIADHTVEVWSQTGSQAGSEKLPKNKEVAVKIIDKSKVEDMNDIDREIEVMKMINHPNVIRLYEIFDEPKKMNLVMVRRGPAGRLATPALSAAQSARRPRATRWPRLCGGLRGSAQHSSWPPRGGGGRHVTAAAAVAGM